MHSPSFLPTPHCEPTANCLTVTLRGFGGWQYTVPQALDHPQATAELRRMGVPYLASTRKAKLRLLFPPPAAALPDIQAPSQSIYSAIIQLHALATTLATAVTDIQARVRGPRNTTSHAPLSPRPHRLAQCQLTPTGALLTQNRSAATSPAFAPHSVQTVNLLPPRSLGLQAQSQTMHLVDYQHATALPVGHTRTSNLCTGGAQPSPTFFLGLILPTLQTLAHLSPTPDGPPRSNLRHRAAEPSLSRPHARRAAWLLSSRSTPPLAAFLGQVFTTGFHTGLITLPDST